MTIPPKQPANRKVITIINAYAPTSMYNSKSPEVREQFYADLRRTMQEVKANSTMVILAGDFNANKLGQRKNEMEHFIGSYGKGTRNDNGFVLADFIEEHNLFASNTTFRHP